VFIPVILSSCTPVSLRMLKCSCAHTLSCLFKYCSFASIGHADIMWPIASSNYYYYYYVLVPKQLSVQVKSRGLHLYSGWRWPVSCSPDGLTLGDAVWCELDKGVSRPQVGLEVVTKQECLER